MATEVLDNIVANYRGKWENPTVSQGLELIYDDDSRQKVLADPVQLCGTPEMDQFSQLPCNQTNPTFGSGATNYQFRMIRSSYTYIEDLSVSITLLNTDGTYSVTTCNPFFFFQQIEATGNGGNIHIQYLYPEGMYHYFANFLTTDQQIRLAPDLKINLANYAGKSANVAAGGTSTFVIPLLGNFIAENKGLFFPGLSDDFVWNFQLGSQPVAYYAGASAAPLTVSSFNMNIHYQEFPSNVKRALMNLMQTSIIEYGFLETYRTPTAPVTYTAGTAVATTLSSIKGFTPYLIFGLRTSNVPAANAYTTFTPLGTYESGAGVELDAQGGRMITGQYPWPAEMLRNAESAKHFIGTGTRKIPGLYSLFFGNPSAAEINIRKDGGMLFTSFENLKLTFGAANVAETAEVWTIGFNGTATAGSYQISLNNLGQGLEFWNFGVTTAPIAYNANLAAINLALSKVLVNSIGYNGAPINCIATGTIPSSGSGLVLTLSNLPSNWINAGLVIDTGMTTATLATSVLTTNGVPNSGGFTTGSYSLLLIQKLFCHMHIERGSFRVFTMQ